MIYGPVVEQGVCRIRTNKGLWELYKDLDVVGGIKRKDWNGKGISKYGSWKGS
jgi:hypothetical protein